VNKRRVIWFRTVTSLLAQRIDGHTSAMTVPEEWVAREANDGSRDDMQSNGYDEHGLKHTDERAPTRTTFLEGDINALDVSERRKRDLRRMRRHQEGMFASAESTPSRGSQNHTEDKRRMISAFAGKLGLTSHQRERAEHLIRDVLDINTYGPYNSEEIILGVISYISMEDMGPDGIHIDDRDEFHDLVDDIETSRYRLRRVRQLTRERL